MGPNARIPGKKYKGGKKVGGPKRWFEKKQGDLFTSFHAVSKTETIKRNEVGCKKKHSGFIGRKRPFSQGDRGAGGIARKQHITRNEPGATGIDLPLQRGENGTQGKRLNEESQNNQNAGRRKRKSNGEHCWTE